MITFLLVLVLILCLLEYFVNHNKYATSIKRIPGLKSRFFVGNALEIICSPAQLFENGRKWANTFNGIYSFYAFTIGVINIYNPKDVEIILSSMKYHEKSIVYTFLKPWLQDGLLLSNGTKWQRRRKVLTSAFHFNILKEYYSILKENSQRLVKNLEKKSGQTIDIVPLISEFTLSSICESAMGTQLDHSSSSICISYKQAINSLGKILVKRYTTMPLAVDFIFNRTKFAQLQNEYIETMHTFTGKIINDKRRSMENDKETDNHSNKYNKNSKPSVNQKAALLDLLIAAEKEQLIDSKGIQEEVDTFMFEGHDTTAAGLIYCLLLIANHEHIQDNIAAELDDILGDDNRSATMEDMTKMKYLGRCIKESFRLYPPVPFISRQLSEPVQLTNYTVPAGTVCNIHIYDLHRREESFENALKFDPDRFLPENVAKMHNYAYIPFSAGPRNCIGQKFAMMETKLAIVELLRNFKLIPVTTPSNLEFLADLVLRNNESVHIKFERRAKM